MGRPSDFTPETANAICEALIEGKSLREICRADDMPSASTVCHWLGQFPEFREQYAHAREAQADTLADEILHIADTQVVGEKRVVKPDGGVEVVLADMIEHRRLQVEARKWLAGKMKPKRYGEKVQLGGDEDGAPIKHEFTWLPGGS